MKKGRQPWDSLVVFILCVVPIEPLLVELEKKIKFNSYVLVSTVPERNTKNKHKDLIHNKYKKWFISVMNLYGLVVRLDKKYRYFIWRPNNFLNICLVPVILILWDINRIFTSYQYFFGPMDFQHGKGIIFFYFVDKLFYFRKEFRK